MIVTSGQAESWLQGLLLADVRLAELVQGRVVSVPGIPGEGERQIEAALRGLFAALPALGTYLPGGSYGPAEDGYQCEALECWVLCAATNSREPGAALRGDQRSLGAWDLVEHVRRALCGAVPDPRTNISDLTPRAWKLLWCNTQLAVTALKAELTVVRPAVHPDQPPGWSGGRYEEDTF